MTTTCLEVFRFCSIHLQEQKTALGQLQWLLVFMPLAGGMLATQKGKNISGEIRTAAASCAQVKPSISSLTCLSEIKKKKKQRVLTQIRSHQPSDTAQPSPPSQAESNTEPTAAPDWRGKTRRVCSAPPGRSRTRPPSQRPTARPPQPSAGRLRPPRSAPLTHRRLRGNTVTWRQLGRSQPQLPRRTVRSPSVR